MVAISGRTGMGSSGSFTVALLTALSVLKGETLSKKDLAEEAFYVEAELADPRISHHRHHEADLVGMGSGGRLSST